ncbi:unnamed protein product [Parnassius apollo]|uniref:(apollo) hypothetical protein n=1 Tax=Parnassius apollo TaxID=110799 RepID=A0A8S3VY73_PARAO|nr:unnamed protein product [Parnassius apollo]
MKFNSDIPNAPFKRKSTNQQKEVSMKPCLIEALFKPTEWTSTSTEPARIQSHVVSVSHQYPDQETTIFHEKRKVALINRSQHSNPSSDRDEYNNKLYTLWRNTKSY